MKDRVMQFLVGFLPKAFAGWLWEQEWLPLGSWAPHVLGRAMGGNVKWGRVDKVKPS